MPRIAVTETVIVNGEEIYKDLASLDFETAKKRSETRRRNQAQAQKRREGHVPTPRGKRAGMTSKAPSKTLLQRLGITDSPTLSTLQERYNTALAAVRDEMKAAQKAFEVRMAEITAEHHKRLAGADDLLKMLAMAEKLPNNEKIVTDLQKRIDALA